MLSNHQIGAALLQISKVLSGFATQLMQKPSASLPRAMSNVTSLDVVKAVKARNSAKPTVTKAVPLSKRHATIVAKFRKAGIKDPKLFTDIKTFDLWSKDGLVPKKGQHGIHGLFHRSQVQPIG